MWPPDIIQPSDMAMHGVRWERRLSAFAKDTAWPSLRAIMRELSGTCTQTQAEVAWVPF